MAGRNFLFVPGPTNVPERIQRAMRVSLGRVEGHIPHQSRHAVHISFIRHRLLGSGIDQHLVAWRQSACCAFWPVQPFVD